MVDNNEDTYVSIFDTYYEIDTQYTCRTDGDCANVQVKVLKADPNMPTKNCCAAFPILQQDFSAKNQYYCYDLNTLRDNKGPYTAAYCADARFGMAMSAAALLAVTSLSLA